MQYKLSFIVVVIVCSISGFLISILNNNVISLDNENNFTKNEINNNKDKNKDLNEEKNKLIDNNDFVKEEDNDIKEEEKKEENKDNQENVNKEKEENKDSKEDANKENENQKEVNNNEKEKVSEEVKNMETEKNNEEKEEDDPNNAVHIALSIDAKYVYPCIVFLTSLLENRKPTTKYSVTILTSKSIDSNYREKINKSVENYGKEAIKIQFIDMKDDFKGALTGMYISLASYYRIALPSLLPKIDKIIYIDSDVINFADLTEMYSLKLKDNTYFSGTLDNIGLLSELKSFGIYETKYMNAGILVMNLKAIRRDGIEQKIRDFIKTHYLDHHDQTAINAVCHNNVEILSVKYACFNYDKYENIADYNNKQDKRFRYSETELKQALYEPTLLHFVGWTKPWQHEYGKSKAEYWWYYAKKSVFYNEILSNYKFSDTEVEQLLKKIPKDGGLLKRNYKK